MSLSEPSSGGINAGTVFAQYQIIRKLGQGGMGEVFLATDSLLKRQVALKFLKPHTRNDTAARERLLAEARAAASVDHPYICKIYEASEVAGTLFISMEFVEGMTLTQRISRNAPPTVKDLVQIAREIAEALAKAHERRLIHRDLKPSNIILAKDGHVKVTDFGLARYLPEIDLDATLDETTEEAGAPPGTPAYMSPEQTRGSRVDMRSDLFSFGVILYEMLTGRHPFKKRTATATLLAILNETQTPVGDIRRDCPESLQSIIDCLLAKKPEERYQSAEDALRDLNGLEEVQTTPVFAPAWRGAYRVSGGPAPNTLAVLPFSNLSAERGNEFFSDGISEELIARIGSMKDLMVISRTSVMRYKHSDKSLATIARELGVAYILEGSVQRDGSRVRVVARLIDVESDHQVWSQIYDRELTDIFAMQADVSRQISESLSANVNTTASLRTVDAGPANAEAYTQYLKGRHFLDKLTPQGITKAIQYFQSSLDEDPAYPNAYVGLAKSYAYSGHFSYLPIHDAYPKARKAAREALALDADLAGAHTALAFVAMLYDWDWVTAERSFKRGIQLNPSDGEARVFYSWYLQAMNRIDEALAEARAALQLDPLSPVTNTNLGHILTIVPQYDECIEHLHRTLETNPSAVHAKYLIGAALAGQGKYDEAIRILEDGTMFHAKPLLAWVYALSGRIKEGQCLLDEITGSSGATGLWAGIAAAYLLMGENQKGAEWLEKAYAERDSQLMHVRSIPLLVSIRSHPKLIEIYRRMGLIQ